LWYKKRTDATALYVARECGIDLEFDCIGDIIHQDDLNQLNDQLLKVSEWTLCHLFAGPTTLEQCLKTKKSL